MYFLSGRILYLLLTSVLWSCAGNAPDAIRSSDVFVKVTRVIDGDTFYVQRDGKEERIRLIGIDAPESRKSSRKEVGYFGKEAREYLTGLLKGKKVRIEYDLGKFDQYKRTLAYAYLENGLFLNAELIKQGYATVMTIPPNIKYADTFVSLQRQARKNKKGLWKK